MCMLWLVSTKSAAALRPTILFKDISSVTLWLDNVMCTGERPQETA